jgi:glutamyl-tRNA synthetase
MMPVNEASFAGNKLDIEKQKEYLQFALWRLEALRTWERDNLFAELKLLADQMGIKIKDALAPVFVAIAGTTASFSVVDSMQIIGPDMSRARIRHAINALGGFGKNKQKDLEKVFDKLGAATEEPAANS